MIRCPICTGSDTAYVCQHLDFTDVDINFCSRCGHWFSHPEPGKERLAAHYQDVYSGQRRQYFNEPYYALMEKRAEAQIQFIKKNLSTTGQIAVLNHLTVLDLGCGIGALTAYLENEGADCIGYDSDGSAIDIGRKRWSANLHVSASHDLEGVATQFDLICLSHFIEHSPDVYSSLMSILKRLRSGGYVFIEVPNCFPEMFSANVSTESHLQFFTRRSLRWLLERGGLEVISCVACGPPGLQAYNLDRNAVPRIFFRELSLFIGKIGGKLGFRPKHIRTVYDGYYDHYSEQGNGLWLRCFGRKDSQTAAL